MDKLTIKSLNDIAASGIQQGQIGEAIKPLESVANKYHVRFPLGNGGWIYTTLYKDIDFIFIEGDYSQCLSNGCQQVSTAPFSLHRSACFNVSSHADGVDD